MDQVLTYAAGTQWVADFRNCECDIFLLENATCLQMKIGAIVKNSGLQIMGQVFHQFEPNGATGLFLLAESHLAIHTWPEFAAVAIDLYVCNVAEDNSKKAARVFDQLSALFEPEDLNHQILYRGG